MQTRGVSMNTNLPNHLISEEERFSTDFYNYLSTPENASRYTPSIDFLSRKYGNRQIRIWDIGCGNAAFAKYLPEHYRYIGIDHSEVAILHCRKFFPQYEFIVSDLNKILHSTDESGDRPDVIILCGLLFHSVSKNTLDKKNDREIVDLCLETLSTDGHLIIIAPFAYSDIEGYRTIDQAKWKLSEVEKIITGCKAKTVWQSMTMQIGVDARVREQQMQPDWFLPANRGDCANRYSGTYLGSWTIILQPSFDSSPLTITDETSGEKVSEFGYVN